MIGFSAGVQIGLDGGITPSASLNLGKGNASDKDVARFGAFVVGGPLIAAATPYIAGATVVSLGAEGTWIGTGLTATTGGALNAGWGEGQAYLFGDDRSNGDRLGSFVAGSLGAPGILRFGGAAPAVGDFLRGGVAEGAGSATGQIYDRISGKRAEYDYAAAGVSGLIGGVGGVVGGAVTSRTGPLRVDGLTAGRNNWRAVYQGRLTARENGYIYNISPYVSARGSAANTVSDLPGFAGGNATQTYLGNHLNAVRACAGDKTKC